MVKTGTYPDKTLSMSQCLASLSERRTYVRKVLVGPVFVPTLMSIVREGFLCWWVCARSACAVSAQLVSCEVCQPGNTSCQ